MVVDFGYMPVFPSVKRYKEQGVKLLEEASECREAYEQLRESIEYYEERLGCDFEYNGFPGTDGSLRKMSDRFSEEAADVVQVIANMLYTIYGDHASDIMYKATMNVIKKNKERGRYED